MSNLFFGEVTILSRESSPLIEIWWMRTDWNSKQWWKGLQHGKEQDRILKLKDHKELGSKYVYTGENVINLSQRSFFKEVIAPCIFEGLARGERISSHIIPEGRMSKKKEHLGIRMWLFAILN